MNNNIKNLLSPGTVWKIKTGNSHLKAEFIDWIVEKKRKFVILMSRAGMPVDPMNVTQDELNIFSAWICETEGIKYGDD